ncbi:MAG: hypothetical protein AB7E55_26610 [Pigmentiphaga sp.]
MIETTRKSRPQRTLQRLHQFTPVPRKCARHDGWTPERQHGFIEALADTGSVRAAATAVNMTPEGAYLLRRHPEGKSFRKAWEAALALGVQRLEDVAMDRALHSIEVPVYSYGKLADSLHNLDAATRSSLNLKIEAMVQRRAENEAFRLEWEGEQDKDGET